MLSPELLLPHYLPSLRTSPTDRLVLGFSYEQSKALNSLKKWGQVDPIAYRRPVSLYHVRPNTDEYAPLLVGFMHGFGFQTLWVLLSEFQAWGIRSVVLTGFGGHTFKAPKGQGYWISKAYKQISNTEISSDAVKPQTPVTKHPLGRAEVSCVSTFSPYESQLDLSPVIDIEYIVDMEVAWFFERCNALSLACGAVLRAYDFLGSRAYKPNVHTPLDVKNDLEHLLHQMMTLEPVS